MLTRTNLKALTIALIAGSTALPAAAFTGSINTDASGVANPQPFNNMQPSLAVHMTFPIQGTFGNGLPIRMFAYSDAKMAQLAGQGWIAPAGQVLSVAQNQALFSQLSNNYGGNGTTTFALPDLRGRTPIGQGMGFATSDYVRGQVVGAATSTLNLSTLPEHLHVHSKSLTGVTGYAGGGMGTSSMQPSIAMNWEITVGGDFPPHNGNGVAPTPNVPCRGVMYLHSATPLNGYATLFQPADGAFIPLVQNTGLFAILGTTYGGNGQTMFGKPDLRGSALCGTGDGPATEYRLLGEVYGEQIAPIGPANLPSHIHTISAAPQLGATHPAGGGQPFSNAQRTLASNYYISLTGAFPTSGPPSDNTAYLGEIIVFAGSFDITGYARCEGQLLPISQNQSLFSLLGTTFGGNGTTTFALPDMRGRVPVGAGSSGGASPAGTQLGTEMVTLTNNNIPAHSHTIQPVCPGDVGKAGGLIGPDGLRDNNDFIAFINLFFLMDPWADLGVQGGIPGSDGQFDNNDFIQFIEAFFADCPW